MLLDYFEIFVLTLINSGGIFLIIILSANSLRDRLNLWLTILTISIIGWVNFAYLGYNDTNSSLATFFYKVNFAFVSLFFLAEYMLYFETFFQIKKALLRWPILTITILFVILALFTDKLLIGVEYNDWGNEAVFGPFNDYFSLFAFVMNIGLIGVLIYKYFKLQSEEKRKVVFFLIGTFLLILFNIIFNVITPEVLNTARYQHFGDYSAVLFLIFTSYAIISRKFMNVRIALTAFLIGVIGMLIIVDMLVLSRNLVEQGVKFLILIFFSSISILLVRSVLNEIRQKEEIAKANVALAKSRQRYFDLATEQKDIIDVMGHEIRTPLTAIIQELNLQKSIVIPQKEDWLNGKVDEAKAKEMLGMVFETLDTVDKASAQAISLVNDMLETARLDKKRFELNYEKFNIVELAKTSVDIMTKTITSPNIHLGFVNELGDSFEVEADKIRIREALDALLNNAIKYLDPKKPTGEIEAKLSKQDGFIVIAVKDNGLGIDAQDIDKLGKKFVRLNSRTQNLKRPGGTGLGLFVVKGIMQHHKGELGIESPGEGLGSTFTLKFPIVKPAEVQKTE